MRRFALFLGMGLSVLAEGDHADEPDGSGLTPAAVRLLLEYGANPNQRALRQHDPGIDMPDTIADWHALWWARFYGCAEVCPMPDAQKRRRVPEPTLATPDPSPL